MEHYTTRYIFQENEPRPPRRPLRGIDISRMGIGAGNKTLLKIAEMALDISNKNPVCLDSIKLVGNGKDYPELHLFRDGYKTTIRYFNGPQTNYPFVLSDGNDITREVAREVCDRVRSGFPEMGIEISSPYI